MKTSVIMSPLNIVIRDAEVPEIGDNEVLVKLDGTGVCASNLPAWEGREWFSYPFEPGAPGHEGYGSVAAVGSEAGDFSVGDKVAFLSYHAFAEFDKARESDVVRIPESLTNNPFPGEPAACAVNVFRRSDIRNGQKVLIIGAGYLGCMLVQLAKNAGAEVAVVSRRKTSLEFASMAGADHVILQDDFNSAVAFIRNIFPEKPERVIEATGVQSSIDLATEVIGIRGRMIIAGYRQDGSRNVNMQVWNWKGIDVVNAHEREPEIYISGLREALSLAEKNILQPGKFITHFVGLNDINEAFRMLKGRPENFLKAVIKF